MSRVYLCIRCWRSLPADETFYRCPACETEERPRWARRSGSDGPRPVSELRRPWWRRLFEAEPHLACPRHPEAEIQLSCECGARLLSRARLDGEAPLGLGFAGTVAAGKTLFIITAIAGLKNESVDSRRVSLLPLGDTEERFARLVSGLLRRREKPSESPPPDHEVPVTGITLNFCWEVFVGGAGRPSQGLLAVHDTGGETWHRLADRQSGQRFDRYLSHLSSVVFLIDGAPVAADLGLQAWDAWDQEPREGDSGAADLHVLSQLAERLGSRAPGVDVALVLSKSDLLWTSGDGSALRPDEPDGGRREAVAEALRASGRGALLDAARGYFREVELFAVSSLGFRPAPEDVDEENHLLRPVEPVGVTEPLVWLLGQRVRGLAP